MLQKLTTVRDRDNPLEHMGNHLIALVGHQLWTPLCTIQVGLESLAHEPELPAEYRHSILDTALKDLEHLQQFIQDVFTVELPQQLAAAQSDCGFPAETEELATLERIQTRLSALVGHELRTPLCGIQVCLESLMDQPEMLPEFRQSMLDTALKDAERLHQLIQDFFTLSRLQSGRLYHYLESISFPEVVEVAVRKLKTSWTQHPIPPIHVQLPPELPLVRADGERLVKVLTKLLDNACKFTPPSGQVMIQAQVRNCPSMLEVLVADTGRGLAPNQLETIFACFYQGEEWLRRTVSGTGLGLAICRQIIQGMGGQIWAESSGYACGSRFHFTIPIESDSLELGDSLSMAERWPELIPERLDFPSDKVDKGDKEVIFSDHIPHTSHSSFSLN